MPKFVMFKDDEPYNEAVIEKELTTIGRARDCDIVINDAAVSRYHLRIICILGDCFLEDLNSANGTMVNDHLTRKCPLEHGDTISIGEHKLRYVASHSTRSEEEEFDQARIQLIKQLDKPDETRPEPYPMAADGQSTQDTTVITRPDTDTVQEPAQDVAAFQESEDEQPQEPLKARTKAENPKARTGNLIIISGKRQGHNMVLNKSVTSIDKSGQRVAAITKRPDGYFLVPLGNGSPNDIKVVINGEEIRRRIFPLWSNDIIVLGGTEMEFLFKD